MIVLGVDPGAGKRTGVAVVETAGDRLLLSDDRGGAGRLREVPRAWRLDRRRHDVVAVVEAEDVRRYTLYHAWGADQRRVAQVCRNTGGAGVPC